MSFFELWNKVCRMATSDSTTIVQISFGPITSLRTWVLVRSRLHSQCNGFRYDDFETKRIPRSKLPAATAVVFRAPYWLRPLVSPILVRSHVLWSSLSRIVGCGSRAVALTGLSMASPCCVQAGREVHSRESLKVTAMDFVIINSAVRARF